MFLGADVDGLDDIAKECQQGAEVAGEIVMVLEAICAAAWIFGPFGASFIAYLKSVVIPWLKKVQQALSAFAQVLSAASQAQRQTSQGLPATAIPSYTTPTGLPSASTGSYPVLGSSTGTDAAGSAGAAPGAVATVAPGTGVDGALAGSTSGITTTTSTAPDGTTTVTTTIPAAATAGAAAGLVGGVGASALAPSSALAGTTAGSVPASAPGLAATAKSLEATEFPDAKGLPHTLEKAYGTGTSTLGEAMSPTSLFESPTGSGGGSGGGIGSGGSGSLATPPVGGSAPTSPGSYLPGGVTLGAPIPGAHTESALATGSVGGDGTGLPKVDGKLVYATGDASAGGILGPKLGAGVALAGAGSLGLAALSSKQSGSTDVAGLPFTATADERVAAEATAAGVARAGVTYADGHVVAGVDASAEAFAGLRAKTDLSVNAGDYVKAGVEAQAQLGIGVKASAAAIYDNGVLHLGAGVGAALGPGASLTPYADVNVAKIATDLSTAGHTAVTQAEAFGSTLGLWPAAPAAAPAPAPKP